jgi:hypothetical protein
VRDHGKYLPLAETPVSAYDTTISRAYDRRYTMLSEAHRAPITVDALPTMEWMLEQLVADGELRCIPRNPEKLDALPKAYDVAPHVDGERRAELIRLLRAYEARRDASRRERRDD